MSYLNNSKKSSSQISAPKMEHRPVSFGILGAKFPLYQGSLSSSAEDLQSVFNSFGIAAKVLHQEKHKQTIPSVVIVPDAVFDDNLGVFNGPQYFQSASFGYNSKKNVLNTLAVTQNHGHPVVYIPLSRLFTCWTPKYRSEILRKLGFKQRDIDIVNAKTPPTCISGHISVHTKRSHIEEFNVKHKSFRQILEKLGFQTADTCQAIDSVIICNGNAQPQYKNGAGFTFLTLSQFLCIQPEPMHDKISQAVFAALYQQLNDVYKAKSAVFDSTGYDPKTSELKRSSSSSKPHKSQRRTPQKSNNNASMLGNSWYSNAAKQSKKPKNNFIGWGGEDGSSSSDTDNDDNSNVQLNSSTTLGSNVPMNTYDDQDQPMADDDEEYHHVDAGIYSGVIDSDESPPMKVGQGETKSKSTTTGYRPNFKSSFNNLVY